MEGFYIAACGEKGDKGDPGEKGTKWFDGFGPPSMVPGAAEGDYYVDVETGKVYKLTWS
jgi:hypothetical protein